MSVGQLNINHLPSPTWRWLKMNFATVDSFEIKESDIVFEERINGQVKKELLECPSDNFGVDSAMGHDFVTFMDDSVRTLTRYTIPKDTKIEEPVVLRFTTEKGAVSAAKFEVDVQEGSDVTIVMDMTSKCPTMCEANAKVAVRTLVKAKPKANVSIIQIVKMGCKDILLNDLGIDAAEDSNVSVMNLFLGGDIYNGCKVNLSGKKASVNKKIGYFLKNGQKLDMNYVVDHVAPLTESDIYATGVLKSGSSKIFRGTIDLRNGCAGAKGSELEDVILRDDDVVCQSIPVILCSEEDVEGNHGASIGKLDENLLFYLQTRGLSEEQVYNLVANARLRSFCKDIPDETVRKETFEFFSEGTACYDE